MEVDLKFSKLIIIDNFKLSKIDLNKQIFKFYIIYEVTKKFTYVSHTPGLKSLINNFTKKDNKFVHKIQ